MPSLDFVYLMWVLVGVFCSEGEAKSLSICTKLPSSIRGAINVCYFFENLLSLFILFVKLVSWESKKVGIWAFWPGERFCIIFMFWNSRGSYSAVCFKFEASEFKVSLLPTSIYSIWSLSLTLVAGFSCLFKIFLSLEAMNCGLLFNWVLFVLAIRSFMVFTTWDWADCWSI